jgi:hypothetical protein
LTIRVGLERSSIAESDDEMIPWAVNVRRSIERGRKPSKGILKGSSLSLIFILGFLINFFGARCGVVQPTSVPRASEPSGAFEFV